MKIFNLLIIGIVAFALLFSCEPTETQIKAESEKANSFFDRVYDEGVARSPEYQAYLGIKTDNDKWTDRSDEKAKKELEITKTELEELKNTITYDLLDEQTKLSYDLFILNSERDINNFKYRFHNYPVNQMFGEQSSIPAFLINFHQVSNSSDANAYISRINGLPKVIDQILDGLKIREEKNIIPPKFVFEHVLRDIKNIINGTTLNDDFKDKVAALDSLNEDQKKALTDECDAAIKISLLPAYEKLGNYIEALESKATEDDGVWKFPDGLDFYNARLESYTTTNMTHEEIHQVGLDEVARIHDEMKGIKEKTGFKGSLQDFFEFMRNDKQFYYPDTEKGKQAYLDKATALIDTMKTKLAAQFITVPKADLIVKRVEAFREQSAGKAFYDRAALDGSRPAYYYANLYNMMEMPTYQMEALAYHEGVPGHHMQIAISQELEGIPKFRKLGGYTAYTEGWGLYSEFIPKEMGFYSDPYSDFGRLAMELWRACRLVVDTGIHVNKWTREQGIAYYTDNTPNAKADAVKMVERHIVMAGQATAYKIGMLKILELRNKARAALGDKFDIRQFHEEVLTSGPLPLSVLEIRIDNWIKRIKK